METNVTHQMQLPELPKDGEKQMDKLYISRKAAMLALMCEADTHLNPVKKAYTRAAAIIEQIAVEDVQPVKHGQWINHRINDEKSLLHGAIKDTTCSECGKSTPYKTDYCMHCGARMDGDAE